MRNNNLRFNRAVLLSLILLSMLAAGVCLTGGKIWKAFAASQKERGAALKESIWQEVAESSIDTKGERIAQPREYKTFRLNKDALSQLLARAPMEFTEAGRNAPIEISLPMPDGKLARFRAVESPILAPELAAKFPEIKTYNGQGIDDPTATTRFDLMPSGFHAKVLSASDAIYVEPYAKGETTYYISYYARDDRREGFLFQCSTDDKTALLQRPTSPSFTFGGALRTYILAVAATGEYTNLFRNTGDDDAQAKIRALFAITQTINNVNLIYERELSVRFELHSREMDIIYTNPATDPYTDGDKDVILDQNAQNLALVLGQETYDIGHVFGGMNVGGIARIGVVCSECLTLDCSKGRGYSPQPGQISMSFFDGYTVPHEIGHQFAATHIFNGTAGQCGGQRAGGSAYEPGSGSTLMSYAGGCDAQNLQLANNQYFHAKNLEQMISFINDEDEGGECPSTTVTGNNPPTATGAFPFPVPKGTPFYLTGTASDPDGDTLLYTWEEADAGSASPPDTDADGNERALFRSNPPGPNLTRMFPSLGYVLANANQPPMTYECFNDGMGNVINCLTGEVLPSMTRRMTFRFTARDNRAEGGGVSSGFTEIDVAATAGPFLVTQPNTSVTWEPGSSQTVTWDVAGTVGMPIECTHVSISLSTDGGNSFPIVLIPSTVNDGSEVITVPYTPTGTGRIKVQGTIFFDISNADLTITNSFPAVTNTNDSGTGSLRNMVTAADYSSSPLTISFNIPGAGVKTINLSSPLPEITKPVIIDGTTQPGYAGAPLIELNGTGTGSNASGLVISAGSSTVRSLIINRFDGVGIFLTTNGSNMIIGNYIGTDSSGNADLGNRGGGIFINDSSGNQIRSEIGGLSNVISGNGDGISPADGITITGTSTGNSVRENFIGTNAAGTAAVGNSRDGVRIDNASNNNIGDTVLASRNIISGNDRYGVNIEGVSAVGNAVLGNYIGTDAAGAADLGNKSNGVVINQANNNTIGGITTSARNIISGNGSSPCCPAAGIVLVLANGNQVQGNFIGTSAAGTAALSNFGPGIDIANAANNTIGGATTAARNVISGNSRGISITGSSSTGNTVQGNYIGTDATGFADLGNSAEGVLIRTDADNNTIGGLTATPGTPPGNVISGNSGSGVSLSDFDSTGNLVQGNLIGLRADGNAALRNDQNGVTITNSPGNLIGGSTTTARNVISGNTLNSSADGVDILGESSDNNTVTGNYIGVDIDGDTFIGNGGNGVLIQLGADSNTIGGTSAGERNVISANSSDGVEITGSSTSGNLVLGNYIGVRADGISPMFNNGNGALIANSASNNTIGGTAAGAGNVIAFNNGDGVFISSATSIGNSILSNAIHSNTGLGIDLGANGVTPNDIGDTDAGANNLQNFPVLTSVTSGGGGTSIEGTLNSSANTSFRIEFFSSSAGDASGNGEGQTFIGSATVATDASGNGSFTANFAVALPSTDVVSATATNALNNTSEFSQYRALCAFSFSQSGRFFAVRGGTGSIGVAAASGCSWAAVTSESWIMIVSGDSGSGGGTVGFEVRGNLASGARLGTITIGGLAITIVQAGTSAGECAFAISPTFESFQAIGGSGSISITTGSSCAWQATTSNPWITITSINVGIGNASVMYSVAANPGPDGRNGTINFGGRVFAVKQKRP
jgi:hypothetical protein